jgi:two-component system, cell cycle response regulator
VDIDGMGAVNTSYGRAKGDALLRLLADALRSSRRQYDIVARWENDEFSLLLPCVDQAAVRSVMTRAASGMVAAAKESGFTITVSVGVAVWTPPSADSSADVLGRASAALEAAKRGGLGSVHVDLGGTDIKQGPLDAAAEPPERVE